MNRLGLRVADLRAFHRTLADSHVVRTSVDVLDLSGDTLFTLDRRISDGQVDVAAASTPTRTATLSFVDPEARLDLGARRMIRVWYGALVADVGWVDCPVFTGPIRKTDWGESMATVEAHGKETFHTEQAFQPFTLRKGMKKTDAVRELLARGGETRFDFPDADARLPRSVSVAGMEPKQARKARRRARARRTLGGQDTRWDKAQDIAESMGMRLFYDGRGVATMTRHPGNAVLTFRDGTGGLVLSPPQSSRSIDRVRNCVRVKGGYPKAVVQRVDAANSDDVDKNDMKLKESDRVRYTLVAPRSHPLSPWSLGLNGKPLYLPEFVDNEHIRSKKEARAVAKRRLEDGLRAEAQITFDSLPVPHLDEWDLVRLSTDPLSEVFRFVEASIPLAHSGVMSVGTRKLVSKGRRA